MYSAEFTGGLSRGVCSPDYHYTPQIICYIVVLKVLKVTGDRYCNLLNIAIYHE